MKNIFTAIAGLIILGLFAILILSVAKTSIFGEVESGKYIYFEIAFLLLLAILGEIIVVRTKQPSVMILMVLGAIISSSTISSIWNFANFPIPSPNILKVSEIIHIFAQFGAMILLFKVGLESKIEKIFAIDNLVVALLGVIVPFVIGYFYAQSSGGSFVYSLFLGSALTATSVGVSVAILKEMKLIEKRFAQIIIGAAVIDDIIGLIVLSLVINVSVIKGPLINSLVATVAISAIFILGSVIVGKKFLNYINSREFDTRGFLLLLAFVLFYSYLAEYIKLSAIVGAFIAGLSISQSKYIREIDEKIYGLEMLFVPVFFISLGMMIDINSIATFVIPIVVLSLIAIASKFIGCAGGALIAKLEPLEAAIVGLGMAPRGEVALIVGSIALSYNAINSSEYSIIASMATLTTFITPPILQRMISKTSN